MNKIHILCPACEKYGRMVNYYNSPQTTYYLDCCGRWLLDGNLERVIGKDDLIAVLKQGSWKVGWAWKVGWPCNPFAHDLKIKQARERLTGKPN
jgi:hypothetical protein